MKTYSPKPEHIERRWYVIDAGGQVLDTPELPQNVAPMVLVYAGLLALGDAHTVETAKLIRERWIDGPFERYRAHTAG